MASTAPHVRICGAGMPSRGVRLTGLLFRFAVTAPVYGAASTLSPDGSKLCPFNKADPTWVTGYPKTPCLEPSCYFYRVNPTATTERICPHPNCDVIITSYCTHKRGGGGRGRIMDYGCEVSRKRVSNYSASFRSQMFATTGADTASLHEQDIGWCWALCRLVRSLSLIHI